MSRFDSKKKTYRLAYITMVQEMTWKPNNDKDGSRNDEGWVIVKYLERFEGDKKGPENIRKTEIIKGASRY